MKQFSYTQSLDSLMCVAQGSVGVAAITAFFFFFLQLPFPHSLTTAVFTLNVESISHASFFLSLSLLLQPFCPDKYTFSLTQTKNIEDTSGGKVCVSKMQSQTQTDGNSSIVSVSDQGCNIGEHQAHTLHVWLHCPLLNAPKRIPGMCHSGGDADTVSIWNPAFVRLILNELINET